MQNTYHGFLLLYCTRKWHLQNSFPQFWNLFLLDIWWKYCCNSLYCHQTSYRTVRLLNRKQWVFTGSQIKERRKVVTPNHQNTLRPGHYHPAESGTVIPKVRLKWFKLPSHMRATEVSDPPKSHSGQSLVHLMKPGSLLGQRSASQHGTWLGCKPRKGPCTPSLVSLGGSCHHWVRNLNLTFMHSK